MKQNHPSPRVRSRTPLFIENPPAQPKVAPPPGPMPAPTAVERVALHSLQAPPRSLRNKGKDFVEKARAGICEHNVEIPIFAYRSGAVAFGGEYLEVYRELGWETVPVVYLDDRPPAQAIALQLWWERLAAEGEWNFDAVREGIETILKFEPDRIASTAWPMAEIDFILHSGAAAIDDALMASGQPQDSPLVVTRPGDLWNWPKGHPLLCGNARDPEHVIRLMNGRKVLLLIGDPPYGISVEQISGHHKCFLEGDGMSPKEAFEFHQDYLKVALHVLADGALIYLFMDGRGMHALLSALLEAGLTQKSIITWDKASPSQGGFMYRGQSEFVILAKHGKGKHVDNVSKGTHRRRRTTVWTVPGYAQFRPDRQEALRNHSCTKPQALLIDVLIEAANIGDVCYDPFCGSGSSILAAERTKRVVYGMEINPEYCDTAIRRMFELTGAYPVLESSGQTFGEIASERGISSPAQAMTAGGVDE